MGDYLDVNGKSALGEELAEAAGIGSAYSIHSYGYGTSIFCRGYHHL
jgi:hypothetical protein